jgi:hypothetical protein
MSACANDTDGDGNCAACARNPEAPCRTTDPETVTISKAFYAELIERSTELAALDAYGVDNWEGYGEAMRSLEEDEDE